ncbi:hypothetical protein AB9E06_37900, partial [Rhizobium leguminosarum]|uniref:hypothetical protein n=1 Tax=Rhizobium leguminosarum TaxID=384 RepID=UPI003F974441
QDARQVADDAARREQMIITAARAMHQHGRDSGTEHATWDTLRTPVRQDYLDSARAAVDALLDGWVRS